MNDSNKKVPALWLEQAALGELNEGSRATLEARLAADELDGHRDTLLRSNEEILRELPSQRLVEAIKRRAERSKRQDRTQQWMSVAWSTASMVSIAALLIVLYDDFASDGSVITQPGQGAQQTLEATRIKGLAPHLVVYRKVGDAVERLSDGAKVAAGDVLQVAYVSASARYGVVFSIDGAGAVTFHMPQSGQSVALAATGETLLGQSYQLDTAPAFERFYLVSADHRFDVALVERAAQDLARSLDRGSRPALALPAGLNQVSFVVTKVQP